MSRASIGVSGVADNAMPVVFNKAASPGTLKLTDELHANRILILDAVWTTAGLTIKLPPAIGSGNRYTIFNNAVQTLSTTVAVHGAADVMVGRAVVFSQTVAESGDIFLTTATDDTYTFNISTTGGLRGDWFVAIDWKPGSWLVDVSASGGGTLATGFSAAVS